MATTGAPLNIELMETRERSPENKFNAAAEAVNTAIGEFSLSSGANVFPSKSISISGNTVLEISEMSPFMEITGALSADAVLELTPPLTGEYIVYITNSCTGYDLYVQKTGDGDASQILFSQTARVKVKA